MKNLAEMTSVEIQEWMSELKREAIEGGNLYDLPCPMCGRPRSQRSDYARCTPCATNWLMKTPYQEEEDLSVDPRIERFNRIRFPNGVRLASASMGTSTALRAVGPTADAEDLTKVMEGRK